MDSILYNQEVTADILNNIAVDLGNTSFNGFGTEKFGADELNKITADLVSSGILISDEKCKAVFSNENIIIQPGIIVFANGAKKKITEAVSFPAQANTYIYALNKVSAGTCELIMSVTNPNEDEEVKSLDYVTICGVDSNKKIIDMRTFSSAKVAIPTENQYHEVEVELYFIAAEADVVRATIDTGHPYRYVITEKVDGGYPVAAELYDGESTKWLKTPNSSYEKVSLKRNGTKIEIYTTHTGSGGSTKTKRVKLYFA